MDLTPEAIDELLGAWALGALDGPELEAVEAALAAQPELAARAGGLSTVVALLGEADAGSPPPELRAALLERAASAPSPRTERADPVTLLERRIEAFAAIAANLDGDDWALPAPPYRWTVHGLLAHLLVIERYSARQLGLTELAPADEPVAHLDLGAADIADELTRDPAATRRSWHEAARAVVAAFARGEGPDLDAVVPFHGWPFPVRGLLTVRAFEIWIHGEDLCRAVGRPLPAPPPAPELRTMSSFSVGALPVVMALDRTRPAPGPARVVLTGEGGGSYDLGPPGVAPDTVLVLDVVDYCRLAARRARFDQLDPIVEGDPVLVERLVEAAQLLAV